MDIESLYRNYVQKSRIFLYPALDIKKGGSVTPIQTFVSWEGQCSKEDCKLVLLYHLRQDEEFRNFEKAKLTGNPLFHDFRLVEDDKGVYMFDYSALKDDWESFLQGKYSKLSPVLKRKIQEFFGVSNRAYIDGFLYPERYFKLYAPVFTTVKEDVPHMHNLLKEVGELCSVPEIEKENLIINIADLHISKKSL